MKTLLNKQNKNIQTSSNMLIVMIPVDLSAPELVVIFNKLNSTASS